MNPSPWLVRHVRRLRASYQRLTGSHLIDPALDDEVAVEALEAAPFALLSHGTESDPLFNYGNRSARALFELSWEELTCMPSRLSAEPLLREERERLLARVAQHGYIADYSGVRISRTGKRFRISHATVWNLQDEDGAPCGQAALLPEWQPLA